MALLVSTIVILVISAINMNCHDLDSGLLHKVLCFVIFSIYHLIITNDSLHFACSGTGLMISFYLLFFHFKVCCRFVIKIQQKAVEYL